MATRIEKNRAALAGIRLVVADAVFEVATEIIGTARPHDAPERGVGLTATRGAAAWLDAKKVHDTKAAWISGQDRRAIRKPKRFRTRAHAISAIAGFGAPHAHLVEFGTVHSRAFPFLTPAAMAVAPRSVSIMRRVVQMRMKLATALGRPF